jgi:hypothetical protein
VNTYVTGAGASKKAGYPLGAELLSSIGKHINGSSAGTGSIPDKAEWDEVCEWLEMNPDVVIHEAYRNGNLEYLFTSLDLAAQLARDNVIRESHGLPFYSRSSSPTRPPHDWGYRMAVNPYVKAREVLFRGLGAYLRKKHHDDRLACDNGKWGYLRQFGQGLNEGDVVITFNYDSTLERVLIARGMWHPGRGYGFKIDFVRSWSDRTPLDPVDSPVSVLHLHGAVGWYQKDFVFADHKEPALITKAVEEPIWLDSEFLKDLGFDSVCAWPETVSPNSLKLLLYPSFLKTPGVEPWSRALVGLWRMAAEALRRADKVFIIGYSPPAADTGAAALLVGNCDRHKVEIVNPDEEAIARVARLLSLEARPQRRTLEGWLTEPAGCL